MCTHPLVGGIGALSPADTSCGSDFGLRGSFLHNATVAMFERYGFERGRQIGKHHWVVSRRVG
jgi:hypothetical protein